MKITHMDTIHNIIHEANVKFGTFGMDTHECIATTTFIGCILATTPSMYRVTRTMATQQTSGDKGKAKKTMGEKKSNWQTHKDVDAHEKTAHAVTTTTTGTSLGWHSVDRNCHCLSYILYNGGYPF